MSVAKIPTACIENINKCNKHFLWNTTKDSHKQFGVNWKTVCLPKGSGCFDIRNLEHVNIASQLKLSWKLLKIFSLD